MFSPRHIMLLSIVLILLLLFPVTGIIHLILTTKSILKRPVINSIIYLLIPFAFVYVAMSLLD